MKISVVMATYNGEKYLKEQLDTIRLQTRMIDEVIICDDRSSDQTVELVKNYILQYGMQDSWQIVVNEKNLGYANNFNKVTLLASGDIIFFSDQDDLWELDKVQKMTEIMESHSDCMVLCTDYEPFYTGEKTPRAPQKVLDRMPNNSVLEKITLKPKSVYIGALGCCMCVRRDFYHAIKEYWFDDWAQDDRMWRLAQCADGCYILHCNLLKHRIHDNNTSTYGKYHTIEKRVQLFDAMLNADIVMEKMLSDNHADRGKRTIMKRHIQMMKRRIDLLSSRRIIKSIPLLAFLKYYQEVKSYFVEIYLVLKNY